MADAVVDADSASEDEVKAALGLGAPAAGADTDEESTDQEGDQASQNLEDLPEWAQDKIRQLRREAAGNRIKAKQAQKASHTGGDADGAPPVDAKKAREQGRQDAVLEYGMKLARSEVRAALKGVVPDDAIGRIVDTLDLSQFVGDDGEVEEDQLELLKDTYASLAPARKPAPKTGAGRTAQGQVPTASSTRDQFADALGSLF